MAQVPGPGGPASVAPSSTSTEAVISTSASSAAPSSSASSTTSSAPPAESSSSSSIVTSSSTSVEPSSSSVPPSSSITSSSAVSSAPASSSSSTIVSSSSSSSSAASSSASSSASSTSDLVTTSYVVQTITESGRTRVSSSAVVTRTDAAGNGSSGAKGGINIGAVVGGVVGGVAGLAVLGALLWFCCLKKRRSNNVAFDEKTFDPGHRHSVADPLDLLAPSVPNVGGVGPTAGPAGSSPRVDPFPYGSPQQAAYDPYAHAPMQMPDARDYGGAYAPYGNEGGYGVAAGMGAAGAAAAGAGAAAYGRRSQGGYDESEYGHSSAQDHHSPPQHYPTSPTAGAVAGGASAAAIAKQRESAMERQRQRQSAGFDGALAYGGPSGQRRSVEGAGDGDRRTSSSVYQHTDYGSVPDEEDEKDEPTEIPPNYHDIRR